MPSLLKKHYALYMNLFTWPSVVKFKAFYDAIKEALHEKNNDNLKAL
jgi:hypothetical protein